MDNLLPWITLEWVNRGYSENEMTIRLQVPFKCEAAAETLNRIPVLHRAPWARLGSETLYKEIIMWGGKWRGNVHPLLCFQMQHPLKTKPFLSCVKKRLWFKSLECCPCYRPPPYLEMRSAHSFIQGSAVACNDKWCASWCLCPH